MQEFEVSIYEDARGHSPIRDWIDQLNESNHRMDKSILRKFYFQVSRLELEGLSVGEPQVKKFKGYDLYELRPTPWRVFFGTRTENELVLLHAYRKKSEKTPRKEIQKALIELENWRRKED